MTSGPIILHINFTYGGYNSEKNLLTINASKKVDEFNKNNGINRDTDNTTVTGNEVTTGALEIDITVDVASIVNAVDNIKNLPENLKEIGKKIEAAGKAVVAAKEKLSEALAKLSPAKQQEVKEQVGAVLLASNDKYFAAGLEVDEEYRKELAKIPQSDYEARTELQTKHVLEKQAIEAARLEKEREILTTAARVIAREEAMVVDPKTGLHVPYYDSKNLVTIGYGTLIDPSIKGTPRELFEKYKDGMTEEDANKELHSYINNTYNYVDNKFSDLSNDQKGALISLIYNTGQPRFEKYSINSMLSGGDSKDIRIPNGDIRKAWTIIDNGGELSSRREREWNWFDKGNFNPKPIKNFFNSDYITLYNNK